MLSQSKGKICLVQSEQLEYQSMIKEKLLGLLGSILYSSYASTFRYRYHFEDLNEKNLILNTIGGASKSSLLFAFFHQEELAFIKNFTHKNFYGIVSASQDGQIMTSALQNLGFHIAQGSSNRGGASAFLKMLKVLKKKGGNIATGVDGPRGPIYEPKEGLAKLSQMAQVPILPVRCIVSRRFKAQKSWSHEILPMPFARIDIYFLKIDHYDTKGLKQKLCSIPLDY